MNGASQGRPPLGGFRTSYLASRKVRGGAIAGGLSVVLVWISRTVALKGSAELTGGA